MDNISSIDRNITSTTSPTAVEQVTSTTHMENNLVTERNSDSSNSLFLELVARMIILPKPSRVNPFSRPRDFDALKSERARLETFSQPSAAGWPISFIRPEDCAVAGFFFLQDGDKVQCAFCNGVVGEWEQGDIPLAEHKRHFPRCPFICNLPVGNVPLDQEGAVSSNTNQVDDDDHDDDDDDDVAGVDVCGPYAQPDIMRRQPTLSTDQLVASARGSQLHKENVNEVITSLGIKTCGNGPAHRNLVTVHSRVKTFTNWPAETGQSPETMAEAGFFYIGCKDHVKCFYCDGGLRNWESSDDPFLEHARWFTNCTYVILNKGDFEGDSVQEYSNSNERSALTTGNPPIRIPVSDQELRELIDAPIVQAALKTGVELTKVKEALKRQIQQTGQPFLTTEALLEDVLGKDSECSLTSSICGSESKTVEFGSESKTVECVVTKDGNGSEGSGKDKDNDLEEEVRKLREQTSCKICMDNQVGIVFLPCGHLVSCTRCATTISNCALCRQPIKAVVRTYLS